MRNLKELFYASSLTSIRCNVSLRSGRLIAFSDSVLVVAVVLLVYNLATLATAEPNAFQGQIFLYILAAYVGSFIVVFLYWIVFTSLLEYIKDLDDIVVSLSLIFLILVTLTSWKCSRTTKTILLVLSAL
jgi:uncharacterized membrane protein